jgi:hypothetical protein
VQVHSNTSAVDQDVVVVYCLQGTLKELQALVQVGQPDRLTNVSCACACYKAVHCWWGSTLLGRLFVAGKTVVLCKVGKAVDVAKYTWHYVVQ